MVEHDEIVDLDERSQGRNSPAREGGQNKPSVNVGITRTVSWPFIEDSAFLWYETTNKQAPSPCPRSFRHHRAPVMQSSV